MIRHAWANYFGTRDVRPKMIIGSLTGKFSKGWQAYKFMRGNAQICRRRCPYTYGISKKNFL